MGILCPFKVADHGLNKMATPLFPRALNLQGTTLLWSPGEEQLSGPFVDDALFSLCLHISSSFFSETS